MRKGHRSGTRCWVKQQSRHHKNAETAHADLAGSGGEWGTPDVGCGKLISREREGVSASCLLKSVEGILL